MQNLLGGLSSMSLSACTTKTTTTTNVMQNLLDVLSMSLSACTTTTAIAVMAERQRQQQQQQRGLKLRTFLAATVPVAIDSVGPFPFTKTRSLSERKGTMILDPARGRRTFVSRIPAPEFGSRSQRLGRRTRPRAMSLDPELLRTFTGLWWVMQQQHKKRFLSVVDVENQGTFDDDNNDDDHEMSTVATVVQATTTTSSSTAWTQYLNCGSS